MKTILTLLVVCLSVAVTVAQTDMSADKLIRKSDEGNRAEVTTGQLALQNSNDTQIQQWAAKIVEDHQQANVKVKELAKAHNVQLNDGVTKAHKDLADKLSSLNGEAFDREYLNHMEKAHKANIEFYEQQAETAPAEDLRNYFRDTLPALKSHLAKVQELQKSRNQ